jgi:L-fucose isomerase-like protein
VDPTAGTGPWTREQVREMQKQQREMRQKQLKEDTTKLLQLATELKQSVDKTNEHVLSLDVVKKAEEIEKLAKHIKTNMRDEAR